MSIYSLNILAVGLSDRLQKAEIVHSLIDVFLSFNEKVYVTPYLTCLKNFYLPIFNPLHISGVSRPCFSFFFLIIAEFRTLLNSNFFFAFLVNSLQVHEIGTATWKNYFNSNISSKDKKKYFHVTLLYYSLFNK